MIEAASETRLKKANDFINPQYTLHLYTDDYDVFTIKIDEDQIYLDDHFYTVVGENGFYQTVEEIHNQQN